MKIIINMFFRNEISGTRTFHNELVKGFKQLGHNTKSVYIVPYKNKLNEEDIKKKHKELNIVVGYETGEMLKKYNNLITDFDPDLIIFSHPCPTMNKSYITKRWQNIYRLSGKRCYIVFHEPRAPINWIADIKEYIIGLGAVQDKAVLGIKQIKEFNDLSYKVIDFPVDFTDSGFYTNLKEECCISTHRMVGWKHVDIQIRAIPHINCPMYVTGKEIEYYYMAGSLEKRKEKYKNEKGEWIWEKAMESGNLKHLEVLPRKDLINLFKKAMCSVDMSIGEKGNIISKEMNKTKYSGNLYKFFNLEQEIIKAYTSLNYSVFVECCIYGIVPILRKKWSRIKLLKKWEEELDYNCAVWLEENNLPTKIADSINWITDNFDNFKKVLENNLNLAKKYLDCKVIANNIIKHYKELN